MSENLDINDCCNEIENINEYSKALIYIIYNDNYPENIYIGSTINFQRRINKHHYNCKKYPNRLVYKTINNNWTDWKFEILEYYPCNSKKELVIREKEIIGKIGTLNKNKPYRTTEEYIEYQKEYYRIYHKEHYKSRKLQKINNDA